MWHQSTYPRASTCRSTGTNAPNSLAQNPESDGRTATVDTPAFRDTIAAYRDMWKAGAIHPTSRSGNGNNAVEAFASGKVGILMTGSYIVNLLTSKYPDVKFAVAPIPDISR